MASSNSRLAKNTLLLYIRMFFVMAVSLYTSRIILEAIGIDDYGIYSVVGGLVVSFSIFTKALSGAGSRFITFHLGKGKAGEIKKAFSTSFQIQVFISIVIIILLEVFGVWFLNQEMKIPKGRLYAANWVLQCSIFTFAIGLLRVPYEAAIIAYERMGFYAKLGIIEVILQLVVVVSILHSNSDRLILYSLLMLFITLTVTIINGVYCQRAFSDCRITKGIDKRFFKDMISFAGWNFIGSSSSILKNQGVDIIVNIYFGVSINAGRGIATQVNNAVTRFSQNFMTALNPQITKSYASNDYYRLTFLILEGSRYSYYLLLLVALPLIIEMPTILNLWLKYVPPDACVFTRLQLIGSMISVLSTTNTMAMLATGKIKYYQLIVGGVSLLNLPVSLMVFYWGGNAYSSYIVAILIEICCLFTRFHILNKQIGVGIGKFIKHVGVRVITVTMLAMIVPIMMSLLVIDAAILRLLIILVSTFIWTSVCVYFVGLNFRERTLITKKMKVIFNLRSI